MAVLAARPVADVTASLIASNTVSDGEGDFRSRSYLIRNVTATAPVILGGDSAVTVASGFQWDAAAGAMEIVLEPGESLYGIVSATPQTIHVLSSGR